ncbi:MAG: hypothetical protein ACP5O1_06335 [Phycisphaerae bacterium]
MAMSSEIVIKPINFRLATVIQPFSSHVGGMEHRQGVLVKQVQQRYES